MPSQASVPVPHTAQQSGQPSRLQSAVARGGHRYLVTAWALARLCSPLASFAACHRMERRHAPCLLPQASCHPWHTRCHLPLLLCRQRSTWLPSGLPFKLAHPCRPRVILWHHAVTFLLLQIPLKHPSLGVYTCYVSAALATCAACAPRRQACCAPSCIRSLGCLSGWVSCSKRMHGHTGMAHRLHTRLCCHRMQDGLIEWNTLFLIARRQFPRYYQQLNWLCELWVPGSWKRGAVAGWPFT